MSWLGNVGGNFQAQSAPVVNAVTPSQYQNAQNQVQGGIGAQQQLVNALGQQNGIGNQANVYNQLQGVANGTGPNPAQAMLNQATGQNVSQQAAMAAGQRGASSNAGLIARQAGLLGANAQQASAGQAATLQANQSLGALGQLGGIAQQQIGNQTGAVQNLNAAVQGNQGQLIQGIGQQNTSNVQNTAQQNSANVGIAGINAGGANSAISGLINAAGGVGAGFAGGSAAADTAEDTADVAPVATGIAGAGVGGADAAAGAVGAADVAGTAGVATAGYGGAADLLPLIAMAHGGGVGNPKLAAVSAGHRYPSTMVLPPHLKDVATIYHGNKFGDVNATPKLASKLANGGMATGGGMVPGTAKKEGDHYSNDTVRAKLSPGEVVIPKSVMESDDPVKGAAAFVAALQKKKGSGKHESDFKQALSKAIQNRKVK